MESFKNLNDPDGLYIGALRILYFILSICGLMFTSILLYILGRKLKNGRHSDTILGIIVVLVDCIASGGLLFKAIFTRYPYNILIEHYNWCAYDMIINTHTLSFSGYALSILSVQRMLLIVFNYRLSIWFWLSILFILNFLCWGQILYQISINNITVSMIEVICISKHNSMSIPIYFSILVSMLATYLLTIISYLSIIVFSCRQCLKQLDLNLDKDKVYRDCRNIILKSLSFLIPYMLIYSGWLFCCVYELFTGNPRTWMMEYVSAILLSTSVVVNCLTILYMNKEISEEFLNILSKFKLTFTR